jgi:hypothetical protein
MLRMPQEGADQVISRAGCRRLFSCRLTFPTCFFSTFTSVTRSGSGLPCASESPTLRHYTQSGCCGHLDPLSSMSTGCRWRPDHSASGHIGLDAADIRLRSRAGNVATCACVFCYSVASRTVVHSLRENDCSRGNGSMKGDGESQVSESRLERSSHE